MEVKANERAITHKLGCYLSTGYPEFDVDCEYNQKSKITKITKHLNGERIYPDVIIPRRGYHSNNLVVIEAKKAGFENHLRISKS